MSAKEDIEAFIKRLPDKVGNGITVVDSVLGGNMLLHMSRDGKIKKFIPSVTTRTGDTEDRSIPRVSTAPSILGCFVGYAKASDDFFWPYTDGEKVSNGWYFYGIPFELALKPNAKLLYDQKNSDEHWLVTYSAETREYVPELIAKCFYREVRSLPRNDKRPFLECTLLIEVFNKPMHFSDNVVLTKGCWEITGPEPTSNIESWKKTKEYSIKEISKGEYSGAKKLSADMLSLQW